MVSRMQLLVIRHALPLRSEPGQGSDPDLSEDGIEQAKRLPDALARFPIKRLVSSPQRRALQTAQPVADALGLTVDVDERLAEYDYGLSHYTPIEEASQEDLQRLIDGHLPGGVDEEAFVARVNAGAADIVAAADHEDTVALFSHGGVINALVHDHHEDPAAAVRPGRLRGRHPAAVVPRRKPWASRRSTGPNTYGICCPEISGGRQVPVTSSTLDGLDLAALDRHLRSIGSRAPVSCAASSSRAAGPT